MNGEYRSLLEKELNDNGVIITKANGNSMKPFIRPNEDVLIIEKPSKPIVKNDIILFYKNGRIVLHRVISVHSDKYDARGDNSIRAEKDIDRSDIIGRLTSVRRNGKDIDVYSNRCRIMAEAWYYLFPLRCVLRIPHKIMSLINNRRFS